MRRTLMWPALAGCVAAGLNVVAAGQLATARPLALVGGTLIDGSGAAPMRNSVVLVQGDRIQRVGTVASLPVPAGYARISTEGMTVLPGLWDMHVHLIYSGHPNPGVWFSHASAFERVTIPASAHQMLMAGVTSARSCRLPVRRTRARRCGSSWMAAPISSRSSLPTA